ncbi:MAG: hypothetical protein SFV21_19255 [Rhodospirillaceae bacterium]|nr:hypothetical protein [Rhodospirillaceae bacterium]
MDNLAIFPAPPRAVKPRDRDTGPDAPAAAEPAPPRTAVAFTGDAVGMQMAMHYLRRHSVSAARISLVPADTPGPAANDSANVVRLR